MSENKDTQNFDLDDILNEFHDDSQEAAELSEDLDSLLKEWEQPDTGAAPMDTLRMTEMLEEITAREAEEPVTMNTMDIKALIDEIAEENAIADGSEAPQTEPIPAEEPAFLKDTMTFPVLETAFPEGETEAQVTNDPTIRMELEEGELPAAEGETEEQSPRIIYNPRTRLRELKKKLVAGPEKRYYELSERGTGLLQTAIILNLILVGLCVAVTTMYSMEMLSANRLRFVIFSQVLAMLLSALLGSHQMLDGLGDLFRGRFTINTLLTFAFAACCADAVFCLSELRIPCCAAFSLEITMALWGRYHRYSTEIAQMDSMRKAVRLNALVKVDDYFEGRAGILRREGEVEDFMDHYSKPSGPEKLQSIYALVSLLLCCGIAVFAGMNHGTSFALQILSTSLLVAVPASFFVALTRPAALLQRRLHMVGTVLCGWQGVKQLCGKAAFPLRDEDLFPANTTKINGVKYYSDRNPDDVLSYTTSLIAAAGGGLVPVFRQMMAERSGQEYTVENFRDYGSGGVGAEICGEPVLLGSLDFLQDMGVEIPQGTMVNQAVYAAIDGQLCAVYAISYAKMRSAAAGLVSLCGTRQVKPVLIGSDFMVTDSLLRAKFSINTRRVAFPAPEIRETLAAWEADADTPALALATRDDLASYAYAVSGARALRTASRLGVAIHLIGGIVGLLIMAAVAILGDTSLLTPTHVLLYQLVWMVPGLLITEWARTA